jgi:hypothetical protein
MVCIHAILQSGRSAVALADRGPVAIAIAHSRVGNRNYAGGDSGTLIDRRS